MKYAIILAAGDGKRMNSSKPKVLMEVLFRPMLGWVLDSVYKAGVAKENTALVAGNSAELVAGFLKEEDEKYLGNIFSQSERKGTGHAAAQAMPFIEEAEKMRGDILVLCGDAPLMDEKTISSAYDFHKENDNAVTVITAEIAEPGNYGRIIRNPGGSLAAIVEAKDCTPEQLSVNEVNSGAYWFKAGVLKETLPLIKNENKSAEYYLTDTIELAAKLDETNRIGAYKTVVTEVVRGANTREQLRELNLIMTEKINKIHCNAGVDIIGGNIIIGKDVTIARDTVILPNTFITGKTSIGENCKIGPASTISDCVIGNGVTLNSVQAFLSVIEDDAKIGPFAHIRPNSVIGKGVKIGDFVEIKNSEIGGKTSVAHLTYIGDSDVGERVNFGCGCVTANYDGIEKYRTTIGNDAFIGCNTNLIAPVKIGNGAMTAAGSTVAENVPPLALAIERTPLGIRENWKKNKKRLDK